MGEVGSVSAAKKRAREGRSFRHKERSYLDRRRLSTQALSLEVKKLSMGRKLTHFQVW